MKILKKILLITGILILLVLVIGLLLPRNVHMERSLTMEVSKDAVYEMIATPRLWSKWSPWHGIDPNMKITYFGPESGAGAGYSWDSENPDAGKGKLTIVGAYPTDSIITEMDFLDQGKAGAHYFFKPEAKGFTLTWTFDSDMGFNPIGRIFGLFMEKFLGPDYEKGLQNLKNAASALPQNEETVSFTATEESLEQKEALSIRMKVKKDEIGIKIGEMYGTIMQYMMQNGIKQTGAPFTVYYSMGDEIDMEAGIPVDKTGTPKAPITPGRFGGGKFIRFVHKGSYDSVGPTYEKIMEYLGAKSLPPGPFTEVYVTDPGVEKDTAKWITHILYKMP